MPGAMVSALVIEIGGAVLVMWLTWRAANGQLGRNDLAGIRTRVTMSSDEAWRTGHRAALPPTLISSVIAILCCAVCIVVPAFRTPASVIVMSIVLLGGALLSIPVAHSAVRRAALEDRTSDEGAEADTPTSGRGR
ncbi:SdpI family protein [Curtobacterium sp. BH-2-1-1]|uniref:SdpI family protein n=1 Tax=Curtobacterium sp. BH-2-1-1 TaxID=1905847 RepID=UPI0016424310|nr:SdpI family protein [Curtobacterium sp. BH-2-1-1]